VIIDVHGHVTHPELLARFPMPPSLGDIDGMIERKLDAGIGVTVVGSPVGFGTMMPVPGLDNYAQPLDRLESFHEWLFGLTERYRPHLLCYAYTNPFGDDALHDATRRWVTHPGVVGLIVNTSVKDTYLTGHARAAGSGEVEGERFWDLVDELDRPVFLHPPAAPVGAAALGDPRLVEQVGRYHDVGQSLAALILDGVLERHPRLRLIGATGAGTLPLMGDRLDTAQSVRHWGPPAGPGAGPAAPAPREPVPASTQLRRIHADTAVGNRHALAGALDALGADRLLFGTDSPPLGRSLTAAVEAVHELGLPPAGIDAVLGGNARRLFDLDEAGRPRRGLTTHTPERRTGS
jgi:predicted TIM-barrel fold metal-dependent hydrolase